MAEHMMLDFETLGNDPDAVVLSLGAVIFNASGIRDKKLWIFNPEDQIRAKRGMKFDTICWWLKQNAKAKEVFERCTDEGIGMRAFMPQFLAFSGVKDLRVWGNGATFDVSIVEHIIRQMNEQVPWKFFHVRCYRTLKTIHPIEQGRKRDGTHHDALDDAVYQAGNVIEFFRANPGADA